MICHARRSWAVLGALVVLFSGCASYKWVHPTLTNDVARVQGPQDLRKCQYEVDLARMQQTPPVQIADMIMVQRLRTDLIQDCMKIKGWILARDDKR